MSSAPPDRIRCWLWSGSFLLPSPPELGRKRLLFRFRTAGPMLEQSENRPRKVPGNEEGEPSLFRAARLRCAAACSLAALLAACGSGEAGPAMMSAGAAGLAGASAGGSGPMGGAAGAGISGSGGVAHVGGAGGVMSAAGMAGTVGSAGSSGAGGAASLRACTGDDVCAKWCPTGFQATCSNQRVCRCEGACDQLSPQAPRHGELACPAEANCSGVSCVPAGPKAVGEECALFDQCALHTTCFGPSTAPSRCYRLCDESTGAPCAGSCQALQGATDPSVCADAQNNPI